MLLSDHSLPHKMSGGCELIPRDVLTCALAAGKRGRRGGDCRMRPMDQGDLQSHIARTVYICDVEKNVRHVTIASSS